MAEPLSFDPQEGRAPACEIFFDLETIPGQNRPEPVYPAAPALPDAPLGLPPGPELPDALALPAEPRLEDMEAPKSIKDPDKIKQALLERHEKALQQHKDQCQKLRDKHSEACAKARAKHEEALAKAHAKHEEHVVKARAGHAAAVIAAESAAMEAWRSQALHPWRGRVLSLPFAIGDGEPAHFTVGVNVADERELMHRFWEAIKGRSAQSLTWIGFNILDFDLPWLLARAWKYRLHGLAAALPSISRDRRIKDLRSLAWGPAYAAKKQGTLDDLCTYLGLEGKTLCHCPFCNEDGLTLGEHAPLSDCRFCDGQGVLHMHGAMVFDLWQAGKEHIVARYGMDDVTITRAAFRFMFPDPHGLRF